MTEDQAVVRIAECIHRAKLQRHFGQAEMSEEFEYAKAAWNEAKAMAREDAYQPIDTAPDDRVVYVKGGTYLTETLQVPMPLDIAVPAKRGDSGYGPEYQWECPLNSYYGMAYNPTHWRPV